MSIKVIIITVISSIAFVAIADAALSCDNIKCGTNQECTSCGQNACNTYSCENPDGSNLKCSCLENAPTCVCKPNYQRANASCSCVPLSCPNNTSTPATTTTETNLTCDNVKCRVNEVCAACGQNACNTYNCFNPDGSKIKCLYKCPKLNPTCICKPGYHRDNVSKLCIPLIC